MTPILRGHLSEGSRFSVIAAGAGQVRRHVFTGVGLWNALRMSAALAQASVRASLSSRWRRIRRFPPSPPAPPLVEQHYRPAVGMGDMGCSASDKAKP